MDTYKIVIADDEKLIRTGLLSLPWSEHHIEVIGVAQNGIEAQELINSTLFDILLTDIRMPGMGGVELAKLLKSINPAAKTILLSGYSEFAYAQQAISIGVHDYILKPSTPDEIINCVLSACKRIDDDRKLHQQIEDLQTSVKGYQNVLGASDVVNESNKSTDIQDILTYIYSHYAENLTLSALAEQFYFSNVYMSYYIKKYTGHTFLEILTSVRMYHVARLLRETKMKNREIAMNVGISDERYLGQVFKKAYGLTPYEYRKSNAKPQESLDEFIRNMGVRK